MIVANFAGVSEFALTLRENEGLPNPLYYLRLFDPQSDEEHVLKLEVIQSNERAQTCTITEAQKTPLREARYFYEITEEAALTNDPQGEIIEVGFFNFKDERVNNEFYK